MKLVSVIEFLGNRLKTGVRICCLMLALLVLLDAIPGLVDKAHAHTRPEHWPGFWAVFGLVGCVALIFASKAIGRAGIVRREDY